MRFGLDWAGLRMFALGPVRLQFWVLSIDCPPALFDQMGSQKEASLGGSFPWFDLDLVLTPLLHPFPFFPLTLSHHLQHLAQFSSASVEQSRFSGDCINCRVQISSKSTRH